METGMGFFFSLFFPFACSPFFAVMKKMSYGICSKRVRPHWLMSCGIRSKRVNPHWLEAARARKGCGGNGQCMGEALRRGGEEVK
ncbi:hypothetical protein V8C43DRAFT_241040 [Trichoderma afarasin]